MTGHNVNLFVRKRASRAGLYALDRDEEGETGEQVSLNARAQNDAFRAAMLSAIARGKEKVKEGVKVDTSTDRSFVRAVRSATHVFTASSLNDL